MKSSEYASIIDERVYSKITIPLLECGSGFLALVEKW